MSHPNFKKFSVAHASSAFATGVHVVLLSWLAVGFLSLSATQLAWVQAASLAPNLLFMLLAGVWADKVNPTRILALFYGLHLVGYAFLAMQLFNQSLSFSSLLIYGVIVGLGNAFIQPAREKLLSNIRNLSVQKRFSTASVIQFGFQSLGIVLASSSAWLDYGYIVLVQMGFTLICLASVLSIRVEHIQSSKPVNMLEGVLDGIKSVTSSASLSQLMGLIAFNGYMHMGVYLVMLPFMAASQFGMSAAEYGGVQLTFIAGMIAAHINLIRKPTVTHPGQGALFSLIYTAVVGFALAKGPTVYGFYFMVFFWGAVAGNSAGRCRLVVQAVTSEALKGRVMSIYQLVLFGFAPVGALVTGYFTQVLSIAEIFYVMSGSSLLIFVLFLLSSPLWKVEQEEKLESEK